MRWALALALVVMVAVGIVLWRDPFLPVRGEFERQRLPAWLSRGRVVVDGHRWVYAERAADTADAPTLVLVHGFTGSKENWYPLARALGIPLLDRALRRRMRTRAQSRLDADARQRNLRDAMQAPGKHAVPGVRLIKQHA